MAGGAGETAGDWRTVQLGQIDSTNAEALRRAEAGDPGRLWVVAEAQSRGRGRHGRNWVSEPGNLYATALLRPECPVGVLATLSFVAVLALRDAVGRLAPSLEPRLRVKWPNDLLCGGAKLAGILLESQASVPAGAAQPPAIAVGIGVNCAHHPASGSYPMTDLREQGENAPPGKVLEALCRSFSHYYGLWDGGAGFAEIRALWLSHAAGIGEEIVVRQPDGAITGVFEDLDRGGALILRCAGALRTIAAGDIFLDGSVVSQPD